MTANPHLLVSPQTVDMDTRQSISSMVVNDVFRPLNVTTSALRQDRILASTLPTHSGPCHLMRVFGISVRTAMDYVYAAHPERRSTLPR
jgi:hypothetical protein